MEWGIAANVKQDKILRTGAKVILLESHGDAEKVKVRGLSRGGRTVEKYIPFKRLENYRASFIPEKLREKIFHWHSFESKIEAEDKAKRLNELWSDVRFFLPTGEMIQDGATVKEAFKRLHK